MSISFPTSLDTLNNPAATSKENVISHSGQHSDVNDAVEALETKVGVNSSAVVTTLDYLLKNSASSDPGHTHTLASGTTGTLTVARGGTGATTLTSHGILLGSGTTAVSITAEPTDGQVLIGSTGNAPVLAAITGTSNQVTVTGGAGTITLATPQSIHTAATPTFASLTLSAATSLTLGTASSLTGAIVFKNATNANTLTVSSGATSASYALTLPTAQGGASTYLVNDGAGVLSWGAATGANTALSNLAAVALNTALLPDAAAADDFGSATLPFKDLYFAGASGTPGTNNFKITGTSTGGLRTITFPDASGTATLLGNSSTGSGVVVLATTPTLVTPVLGVATATSINKVTITAPTTAATLTLVDGSSLITVGANAITLTSTGPTGVTLPTTGTLATLAGTEELDGKTLDTSVGKGTWTASGTWTLPAITLGGDATLSENVSVVLDAALSADGKYCGITEAGTAGATLAFGDLVYLAAADSRWELTDANAAATAGDVKIGMCVLAAAADGSATTILLWGKIRADTAFPAFTISAPVYIGEVAGDVVVTQPVTADVVIRKVGLANTADELFFCPSNDYITHT